MPIMLFDGKNWRCSLSFGLSPIQFITVLLEWNESKTYHTVRTFPKSNRKIVEIDNIDMHSTCIHDRILSWLGAGTATLPEHMHSLWSIFSFLCSVLLISVCHLDPFLLTIVLSVLLRCTVWHPFGIFKLFLVQVHLLIVECIMKKIHELKCYD